MENPIVKLFNELSDADIEIIMNEIAHCEKTGSFPENAVIRSLTKQCSEITTLDVSSNLLMVQLNVFRQGAMRWVKLKKENDGKEEEKGDTTEE